MNGLNLLFKVLIKGLQVGLNFDEKMKADLEYFSPLEIVEFRTLSGSFSARIQFTSSSVLRLDNSQQTDTKPSMVIVFKNDNDASKVFWGKMSLEDAFSRHSIVLFGDIYKAVVLVRLITKTEKYIFPKFITKKIMSDYKLTKNDIKKFKFYFKLLFWRNK